jgi:hypothetical protein
MARERTQGQNPSEGKRKGSHRGTFPDTISNLTPPSPEHERPQSKKGERDSAAVSPGKRAFMKHNEHKE